MSQDRVSCIESVSKGEVFVLYMFVCFVCLEN